MLPIAHHFIKQHRLYLTVLAAWIPVAGQAAGGADASQDLTTVPFEQLMSMEVYSASKFVQPASQAPSSVTVITAAQIRDHGWRTLADIARSVRGLYVNYDRNYSYLGERGFLRPGDYNTRFLLQIDGNRINDAVYDQAPVGGEFPLDLELIERIEFVPGPGSSIYGSNAFFGVINVITKRAAERHGAQVLAEAGSAGQRRAGASVGLHSGDSQLLLSASRQRARGRDLYYPEFDTPDQHHGMAVGLDHEEATRLFASASHGAWRASVMYARRIKGVPTASFAQVFNDPRSDTTDRQTYVNAGWQGALGATEQLSARLFWGRYDSSGHYIYPADEAGTVVTLDASLARWWGVEANLVSTRIASHTLLAGFDLQHDYRLVQYSHDLDPYFANLDEQRQGRRAGLYVQDEWMLSDAARLSIGLRHDRGSRMAAVLSPRVALVYTVSAESTIKAIYGTAFRAPNSYELYYEVRGEGGQLANPALEREQITSTELTLVQRIGANTRLTATVFRNSVASLITQQQVADVNLPRFENSPRVAARGVELEVEHSWANGAQLRTSYSHSKVGPSSEQQINAPGSLAKLNLTTPLPLAGLRAGLEGQYVGARRTLWGEAGAFWVANAHLLSTRLLPGAECSLAVYNLFDRRYADPGSSEHVQSAIPQDGRSVRVKISHAF